jgi:hypothetical protein
MPNPPTYWCPNCARRHAKDRNIFVPTYGDLVQIDRKIGQGIRAFYRALGTV